MAKVGDQLRRLQPIYTRQIDCQPPDADVARGLSFRGGNGGGYFLVRSDRPLEEGDILTWRPGVPARSGRTSHITRDRPTETDEDRGHWRYRSIGSGGGTLTGAGGHEVVAVQPHRAVRQSIGPAHRAGRSRHAAFVSSDSEVAR